jgi:hypothetical protein
VGYHPVTETITIPEDEVRFNLGNIVIFKVSKCLKLFRNRLWIKYKKEKSTDIG